MNNNKQRVEEGYSMVNTIDRAIFTGGSGFTKKEEVKYHKLLKDVIDKYINTDEDFVPIISSGQLPTKYGVAHCPGGVFQILCL